MSATTRAHQADRRSPTTGPSTTRTNSRRRQPSGLPALAETLRDAGHLVHTRCSTPCNHEPPELVHAAEHFLAHALTLSDTTASRHAYVRLYRSTQSLFLEVTQLLPGSFQIAVRDHAAQSTLDALNRWAVVSDYVLSVRQGPRNQLRVALMIAIPDPSPGRTTPGGAAPRSGRESPS